MLRIGTRGSPLAMAQAEAVAAELRRKTPGLRTVLVPIRTSGDETPAGGPGAGGRGSASRGRSAAGAFVREIERALIEGRVDAAVHSLKDLPVRLPAGLEIAAVPPRADVRDCLVWREGVEFPHGARIGTSSRRRKAELLIICPDVRIVPIRGNVGTRLRKIAAGAADGAVLAVAGLARLGLVGGDSNASAGVSGPAGRATRGREESRGARFRRKGGAWTISSGTFTYEGAKFYWIALPFWMLLPAPGQGALAVEIRADDDWARAVVSPVNCRETALAVAAERAAMRALRSGCRLPMGAYGWFEGKVGADGKRRTMVLEGFLLSRLGGPRRARMAASVVNMRGAEDIGRMLAEALRTGRCCQPQPLAFAAPGRPERAKSGEPDG
ncbi:MAG: hydroxymethylbilane synthase [Planctomycetota bacterium]|nr:hydroxymethylbilane synthase [Planctomycetota bacterium]